MKALMSGKFWALLLISVVTASAVSTGWVLAASTKANFTLAASSTTVNNTAGTTSTVTITVQGQNGFKGNVGLTASAPSGWTTTFSPMSTASTSTLAVTTPTTATSGSVSVTGSSSIATPSTSSVTVNFTVSRPSATPSFSLSATSVSNSILPGDTAAYSVTVTKDGGFTNSVTLSATGLPTGATASFSPSATSSPAQMQVATKNNTPSGNYTITITGTGGGQSKQASVPLYVNSSGKNFTMTGPVDVPVSGWVLGTSAPVNVTVSNPNNQQMTLTNITVAIQSVAKAANAVGPCTLQDFAVTQYHGAYTSLVIPAGATRSLSQLLGAGSSASWPQLTLLDRPTNQNGCRGAMVSLTLSGSGQG